MTTHLTPKRRWNPASLTIIVTAWAVLQIGGLFTPGLLDDVDSVYIQIAREMLQRHDFVTPTIDGIRFFDKPPLMYWMAAGSMKLFGTHDWAARLPLAFGMLALLFAVYALGLRFFERIAPPEAPDRAALYAALAMATSIGPYLYTRFYIPDILIALWMTLAVHCFLIALDRIHTGRSALQPMLAFGVVLALSVLTKGLIGIVFPIIFVLLYLVITKQLPLLLKLHIALSTLAFALVAAPWHILAALRNPAIAMPAGLGLPARAGWAWFYLYNEHVARFLGKRIPHDYGQVPIPLFWLLLIIWLVPWAAFLPQAILDAVRELRSANAVTRFDSDIAFSPDVPLLPNRAREAALTLLLWPGIILIFFTLSSRQEYYHLPALPALALLAGGLLAAADTRFRSSDPLAPTLHDRARTQALAGSRWFLLPLGALLFVICGYFFLTAHTPAPGLDLTTALSSNPQFYNLSLGHIFDLTGAAMGFFRVPLLAVALCMLFLGPIQHIVRKRGKTFAANMLVTVSMAGVLLAAHEGLVRFYPILGSKDLAEAIRHDNIDAPVLIDGELTSGSSLLFYLDNTVLLVNGRVNGPWFGSFWPDARPIFLNDADLMSQWHTRPSLYLLTYHPEQRIPQLCRQGPVIRIAESGGKTVLRNFLASSNVPATTAGTNLCKSAQ